MTRMSTNHRKLASFALTLLLAGSGAAAVAAEQPVDASQAQNNEQSKQHKIKTKRRGEECESSESLTLGIDLERESLYVIDSSGRPSSDNLFGKQLDFGFGDNAAVELSVWPRGQTKPIVGHVAAYVDDVLLATTPLSDPGDGTLAATVARPKQPNTVYVLEVDYEGGAQPVPKLVLKPVDTCPPRPPDLKKKKP